MEDVFWTGWTGWDRIKNFWFHHRGTEVTERRKLFLVVGRLRQPKRSQPAAKQDIIDYAYPKTLLYRRNLTSQEFAFFTPSQSLPLELTFTHT